MASRIITTAHASPYGMSAADAKKMVLLSLKTIETMVEAARLFLATGGRPGGVDEPIDYRVNEALDFIAFSAQDAVKWTTRVGPPSEVLGAARNDRAVQKLIKRASRKAPI